MMPLDLPEAADIVRDTSLGVAAGFEPRIILVNTQSFTKTAHIWGVGNNQAGTNTNRIVVFQKP